MSTTKGQSARRPRPFASCVRCGRPYQTDPTKTSLCLEIDAGGKVCGGRITWHSDENAWIACDACGATGMQGEEQCPVCFGTGWLTRKSKA